ncbi:hypothetical protein SAMN05421736_104278 [Evansella caseinilytica]|uniref:Uncharacterized protein n=1 Tax=Evansella caseinilytica TaxID=1503961 RepID=A0A1H3P210_9BACI|nr:hypothetical protein [Evansella caseinilytica]SDY94459.1 hypothetical protein SAMN05421736_104278 [Evansella caseinilytica]
MSLFAVIVLLLSLFISPLTSIVQAEEVGEVEGILIESIEKLTGDSLEGYNFIEYNEPVLVNNDGKTEVLLGYFEPVNLSKSLGELHTMDYREYDKWYVYDQGITEKWRCLKRRFFPF